MLDFIKIFIVVAFTAVCFAGQTFASTLNSVEIKPSGNSFDVFFNGSDNIKAKKSLYPDKMVITLKNTKPANNIEMRYDTDLVDNVVVKGNDNNTQIIIKSDSIVLPEKKYNPLWFLCIAGIILLGCMKRQQKVKENNLYRCKTVQPVDLDYILKHKLEKQERIKIAA